VSKCLIEKIQKTEKDQELKQNKIEIMAFEKIPEIGHTEVLQGSVVSTGIEEEKGCCFRIPDLMRLQRLKGIVWREDHSFWMTVEGNTDQKHKCDTDKNEGLFFYGFKKNREQEDEFKNKQDLYYAVKRGKSGHHKDLEERTYQKEIED
jgi:hypothetical protein